jgi:hypothetical protein
MVISWVAPSFKASYSNPSVEVRMNCEVQKLLISLLRPHLCLYNHLTSNSYSFGVLYYGKVINQIDLCQTSKYLCNYKQGNNQIIGISGLQDLTEPLHLFPNTNNLSLSLSNTPHIGLQGVILKFPMLCIPI